MAGDSPSEHVNPTTPRVVPSPIFGWEIDTPVHEAIGNALGAASMCWDPPPEGVFDSTRAEAICDELLRLLQRKLWAES